MKLATQSDLLSRLRASGETTVVQLARYLRVPREVVEANLSALAVDGKVERVTHHRWRAKPEPEPESPVGLTSDLVAKTVRVRRVFSELRDVEVPYGGTLLRTPQSVQDLLRVLIEHEPIEVFVAIMLDGKAKVSGYYEVSRGTLTSSLVHPREVFRPALMHGAASLIVGHNHPSGDPEPSAEDMAVTARLRQAGELLGVPLQDHFIIGSEQRHVSFHARGWPR
jgi:DNA repair protein RadC